MVQKPKKCGIIVKKMIEIGLLVIAWYVMGILCMLLIQCWLDNQSESERKIYPGHQPSPDVGKQEVFVLGLCGPFVTVAIIYFVVVLWWLTQSDNK